jgi:hypothetical protein
MVTLIKDYVRSTHGVTHNSYTLDVQQVFDLAVSFSARHR